MQTEGTRYLKISKDPPRNRIRKFPSCGAVPQPNALLSFPPPSTQIHTTKVVSIITVNSAAENLTLYPLIFFYNHKQLIYVQLKLRLL